MAKKRRSAKTTSKKSGDNLKRRVSLAWKNFVLFLILFIISFVLYSFATNSLFVNLFVILSIIFGFLSFAFLLALIVLLILKSGRR